MSYAFIPKAKVFQSFHLYLYAPMCCDLAVQMTSYCSQTTQRNLNLRKSHFYSMLQSLTTCDTHYQWSKDQTEWVQTQSLVSLTVCTCLRQLPTKYIDRHIRKVCSHTHRYIMCHVVKYNAKRLSSIVSIANTVFSILKYPHIYQRFHAVISLLNHASIPLFTVFYYYSKLISINLMTIPSSIIKRPLHV